MTCSPRAIHSADQAHLGSFMRPIGMHGVASVLDVHGFLQSTSWLQKPHCSSYRLHVLHHIKGLLHVSILNGNLSTTKPSKVVGTRRHDVHHGLVPAFLLRSANPSAAPIVWSRCAAEILPCWRCGGSHISPCRLRACRLPGAGVQFRQGGQQGCWGRAACPARSGPSCPPWPTSSSCPAHPTSPQASTAMKS